VARFAYDPKRRRVEKVTGAGTTTYTYSRDNVIRVSTTGVTAHFVYGPEIDELLAQEGGSATTYLHRDGHGSVVRETDASGATQFSRNYDAWGGPQSGAERSGAAFTGREWDPETGLYNYRARYYDPTVGRFLSEDPIFDTGSLYAYVGNDPVNWSDPTGLIRVTGNWCGPNWTGGQRGSYNPERGDSYVPPADTTDAACRTHDICYYRCRNGFPCDKAARANCMTVCDRQLSWNMLPLMTVQSLTVSSWDFWIYNWMQHNTWPDPGSDRSCGCPSPPPPPPAAPCTRVGCPL
jgi:RHS repeat-associated protein